MIICKFQYWDLYTFLIREGGFGGTAPITHIYRLKLLLTTHDYVQIPVPKSLNISHKGEGGFGAMPPLSIFLDYSSFNYKWLYADSIA